MNILFKCDQSNFIGLGHYYRCLALSKEFKKDKHKCFFLGLKPGIIKKNHITIKNEKDDLKFTQEFIKKNKIKIIIKDIYSLSYKWEREIAMRNYLVVIDDYRNTKHFCNLYINYNFKNFKNNVLKFLLNNKCKTLIGPKYTIVRKLKIKKKFKFKRRSIFIYMGGSDKNMIMKKFVSLFKNRDFDKILKIFLLNKNHLQNISLMKNIKNIKNKKILKNKIQYFHKYIASSDLCITPAGITMLEQIALRSKNLIIAQNQIQKDAARLFDKAKVINYVQNINKLNYEKILKILNKKINQRKLINLNGKSLVYKKILNYFKLYNV